MSDGILAKHLMILASAGSGKTYQLGNRVIGLVGAMGVDPARIVALTFTRKAAGEFADAVLSKLAVCAADPAAAAALCARIGEVFPAGEALERVVRALPRLQFGTMDGFFAKVVRGFQYELGLSGGTFELIEGPRFEAAMSDILGDVLGDELDRGEAEDFLHAFRRATLGKEGQGVLGEVESFLQAWHGLWKSGWPLSAWGGGAAFAGLPEVDEWERRKHALTAELRRGEEHPTVLELLEAFESHTVGSGKVKERGKTLFERLLETLPGSGGIELTYNRKVLRFSAAAAERWRGLFDLLAGCEVAAAVARTRAVAALVARLDRECERRLRAKGLLGFDDVKVLMGRWARDEEARLRREKVDFRLDARCDHWLLDEFQDTSRAEWTGIVPLLDEAVARDDGSLFVVGDRKQAIYGWRGGDVSLFDEIARRYGSHGDLTVRTMPESWRSCPAVLELVNRVCGDFATIGELFGEEMVRRWPWEDHLSARPELSGEARVEVVAKEQRDERLTGLLHELGVGERALTCGVLVRTNTQVRTVAALLREEGFDVIEEGRRQPVADNPPGVALFHLVRWLADPADDFAREVVRMSPLGGELQTRWGNAWQAQWEALLTLAQVEGFAAMAERTIEPLWDTMSEFSRRRAGDVIGALAEFDARGAGTAREAARWLEGLEIAQSPGAAAVQVMTIHKSKGLGFDVVVLPEIEDAQQPDRGDFQVARGQHEGAPWLLQTPARWVRDLTPALAAAEATWAEDQRYEAMCVLYVALTRAKRGLYVLLPQPPKSRKDPGRWASPANWIAQSVGGDGEEEGPLFQAGDPAWFAAVPGREGKVAPSMPPLGEAAAKRRRIAPSDAKQGHAAGGFSRAGLQFGREVHELFEKVGWVDEKEPPFVDSEAGRLVGQLLRSEACRWLFERKGRTVELLCEQPVEAILDGRWMSGTIDRLHVRRDALGLVEEVEAIDFKTDAVKRPAELVERYAGQMEAYRRVLTEAFGGARVTCRLVSTRLRRVVDC